MYNASESRYEKMKYIRSGKSGLRLPAISLGLWHNFGSYCNIENMKSVCYAAFDNGVVHFDLANNYGPVPGSAEENFGRILKDGLAPYRDELLISTKAGYYMWPGPYGDMGSRKYLISSLDASLKRMGVDHVDIFYHHRPDPNTPLEETMGALDSIVRSGKALYVGLSNYDGKRLKEAEAILRSMRTPFVINQNRYSILDRTVERNGLLSSVNELGLGLIVFSPLEQGLLTDRYLHGIPEDSRVHQTGRFLKEKDITEEKLAVIRRLNDIAARRGQSLAQMAITWLLNREGVTSVLVGASKPSQIEDNVKAANAAPLTAEEFAEIDAAVRGN